MKIIKWLFPKLFCKHNYKWTGNAIKDYDQYPLKEYKCDKCGKITLN